jgi:hypothetical protein
MQTSAQGLAVQQAAMLQWGGRQTAACVLQDGRAQALHQLHACLMEW